MKAPFYHILYFNIVEKFNDILVPENLCMYNVFSSPFSFLIFLFFLVFWNFPVACADVSVHDSVNEVSKLAHSICVSVNVQSQKQKVGEGYVHIYTHIHMYIHTYAYKEIYSTEEPKSKIHWEASHKRKIINCHLWEKFLLSFAA